jgi:hypothetical protein
LRRQLSFYRVGAGAALGFYLGACGANTLQTNLNRQFDEDISMAFDQRYAKRSLNASGLGSSYISIGSREDY